MRSCPVLLAQPVSLHTPVAAQASHWPGGTPEEDAIFLRPNVWPDGPRGARLRAAMTACYARMEGVSEARRRALAAAAIAAPLRPPRTAPRARATPPRTARRASPRKKGGGEGDA